MSDARLPSLSSLRLTENPGDAVGTMICDMPRWPASSEVRTSRQIQSAWVPFVMNILRPVDDPLVPVAPARVRSRATSDPASGSVTAMAATADPAIAGARNSVFCAWVPSSARDGVAIMDCTPMAMPTPAEPIRPSSSHATIWKEWSAPRPP